MTPARPLRRALPSLPTATRWRCGSSPMARATTSWRTGSSEARLRSPRSLEDVVAHERALVLRVVARVDDDREHPDRQADQLFGAVGHGARERQRIARLQQIAALAMPVRERAFEQIDELHARVLEAREHLAL